MLKRVLQKAMRNDSRWLPLYFQLYRYMKRDRRSLKLLPLDSITRCKPLEQGVLMPSYKGYSHGPKCFLSAQQEISEIQHPDLHFRIFQNARVSAHSSSVVLGDKKLFLETLPESKVDIDYRAGHVFMHGVRAALVKVGKAEPLEQGIFLAGNGAYNYYHWLIEIAAKCQFLTNLPARYTNYPLLVSQEVRDIPTFKKILNVLAEEREVIYLKPSQSYVVNNLVWIDTPNLLPFNMVGDNQLRVEDCYIRKASIDYLRSKLLQEQCEHDGTVQAERVFLARTPGKRDYNQDEVEVLLKEYGFSVVYMEKLDYEAQIEVIRAAKYIIGPTGAAWTNLQYANSGTTCLCWMAEEYGGFSAFSNIAHIVGADMHYLRGKTGETEISQIYKCSYRVDLEDVEAFLERHVPTVGRNDMQVCDVSPDIENDIESSIGNG